ncbi:MAG: transketolase [Alphaproteobacteria bacterium]|nr:transketolase [Alphaproteobacteria bacterium]
MDAVEAAKSGHPGMPMGAADMGVVLFRRFLKHDPADPTWFDRDRFILSAGHGSMLIYSLLHLSGYDLSLDDLKAFRQWGSRTPGHPEHGHTPGVETTTGPLGQGFATGVGMAIAERWMRETWGADLCDHWIYAIVSDGDLMEGISSEAGSLAGHLGLGRLVYLYDDNEISIDGSTGLAFTEDRLARFAAFGWHVQAVDGHDPEAIAAAVEAARAETDRPSLIACRTVIGQGSAKEGTSATHGAPLGAEDVAATKARLGLDPARTFVVDPVAAQYLREHAGASARGAWQARLSAHPDRARFEAMLAGDGEALVDAVAWPDFPAGKGIASRKASAACLKAIVAAAPQVLGGSADLAGSNGVGIGLPSLSPTDFAGARTVHFGVREHAMAAAANGMALHGGVLPYVATFLIFHDYMRPAVRLSCLMKQRVVYVYSHDSFHLGEDGPTHQPIETLLALRSIPDMHVFRPADAAETIEGWKAALRRTDGPTALVLTRQDLPTLDRSVVGAVEGAARGAYVLADAARIPDVVLIATGSEVPLALEARDALKALDVEARVVSAPCLELFAAQTATYRAEVLPAGVPRVSIEAGSTLGWHRWVGEDGATVGIDHFGASAPAEVLAEKFGFTAAHVVEVVEELLGR